MGLRPNTNNPDTPRRSRTSNKSRFGITDEPRADPYQHDELSWCDDRTEAKQAMAVRRRDFDLRARPRRHVDRRNPDGDDNSIDAVRYAIMGDALRGQRNRIPF